MMKSRVMAMSVFATALAENSKVKRVAVKATFNISRAWQRHRRGAIVKTRQKKAAKAGKRHIFGKAVMAKAMPAKTIVKAFPAETFKDEVRVNIGQEEANQAEKREISGKAVTVKAKPGKIIARASFAKVVNDEF